MLVNLLLEALPILRVATIVDLFLIGNFTEISPSCKASHISMSSNNRGAGAIYFRGFSGVY